MGKTVHVVLIAVPILLQVYVNADLAYGLMHRFRVPHAIAAPGALIGDSNFFELVTATAIALFGAEFGAALATVEGILVEVPVMLSVCGIRIGPGIGSRARRSHEATSRIPLHQQLGSGSNGGRLVAASGGRSL